MSTFTLLRNMLQYYSSKQLNSQRMADNLHTV